MDDDIKDDTYVSPSSSPPTPPSPLPISVGPGNQNYLFSPSPSASPPFSPSSSTHASAEKLPLLHDESLKLSSPTKVRSAFSLDRLDPDKLDTDQSSCLKDLLEWFVHRCCSCYTLTLNSPSNHH